MILRCKCSFGTICFSSKLERQIRWSEVGIYPKRIGPSQKYPKPPRRGTIYKTILNTIKIKPRFFFTLAQPRFKKLLQPCENYNEILIWHLLGLEHQVQFYRGQGSYKLLLRHEPILKVSLASIPCTGLEISTWKFIPINWRKDTKFLGPTYLSHPAPVILQGSTNPRHHLKADHWNCDF